MQTKWWLYSTMSEQGYPCVRIPNKAPRAPRNDGGNPTSPGNLDIGREGWPEVTRNVLMHTCAATADPTRRFLVKDKFYWNVW